MLRRRAIGLVSSFISGRFFEQVVRGIQQVARQHQVDLIVVHGTPEHAALTQVGRQHIDGWLVQTYTQGLDLLAKQGKPIVTISGRRADCQFPAVFPDNRQGMEAAMEHLLAQGHREIAFVGDTAIGDIQERYLAYREIMERNALPVDPALVIVTDKPLADRGIAAARQLLASGRACTAVVAGNDWTAIGVMRELQAQVAARRGPATTATQLRIPEDVAIVGFDDIPEAQLTNPPLSTVRQHSEELGATAARLLLAQLAGEPVAPETHYVPTTFVARESSGRGPARRSAAWDGQRGLSEGAPDAQRQEGPRIDAGARWQASLAGELVRVFLPALAHDPAPSPAQVWPEVDRLVQLVAETVDGAGDPSGAGAVDQHVLGAVFASAPLLNANAEILVEMVRVLETGGMQRSAGYPDGPRDASAARRRLSALLDQILIEAMRSYRRRQQTARRTLSEVLQSQYYISQQLLRSLPQELDWLAETEMDVGCLGLWTPAPPGAASPGQPGNQAPIISMAGSYVRDGVSKVRPGTSCPASQFPPLDRLPGAGPWATAARPNDIATWLVLNVRTADHDWGMLAVSGAVISDDPWLEDNTINMLEICCGFLGIALEREALQESLRYSTEHEQALADRVRGLRCPVIRAADGVLLIPLAGVLSSPQAARIVLDALGGDPPYASSQVLLEVASIPASNPATSQRLAETIRLIRGSGRHATLVGASPALRQAVADRGILSSNQPDLAAALEWLNKAHALSEQYAGGDRLRDRPR